jgi:FkbM family methyltransferase
MLYANTASEGYLARIPNTRHSVAIRLGTTDVAAFEHVFIDHCYRFNLVEQPKIIVDAGANAGMSAAYFAINYPSATIIAVEPEPSNFAVLTQNALRFPSIVPVNAALWNQDNVVSTNDTKGGKWGARVEEYDGGIAVRALTMTTLLREHKVDKVDILKMDVEGAECEILESADAWIGQVQFLCSELHDRFRPGCSEAFTSATAGFPVRWRQGELSCVARHGVRASGS